MKTWVRKSLKVGVLSAGIVLSASGTAQASDWHTVDNDGALNGNQLDIPVRIPIDVCGNAVAVAGSSLAHCEIENEGRQGAAPEDTSHWLTRDNVGLLNGNQLLASVTAPINVCGNAIAVLGSARGICEMERTESPERNDFWQTGGNTGLLNGNQVAAILNVPINVCGNAIAVLGTATAHCEDAGGGMRPRPGFPINRPRPNGPGGNPHGPNDNGLGQGPGWNGPGWNGPGWNGPGGGCTDRSGLGLLDSGLLDHGLLDHGLLDSGRCQQGDWDVDDHAGNVGNGHGGHGGHGGHVGHGHGGHGGHVGNVGHGHDGDDCANGPVGHGHGGDDCDSRPVGHGHGGDDCGNGHGSLDSTHGHGGHDWDDVSDDHGNGHGPQDSGDWHDQGGWEDDNGDDNGGHGYGKPSRNGNELPARQDAADALPVFNSISGLTDLTSPLPVKQHAVAGQPISGASQTIDGVVDAG